MGDAGAKCPKTLLGGKVGTKNIGSAMGWHRCWDYIPFNVH